MKTRMLAIAAALATVSFFIPSRAAEPVRGWLNWRGPLQNGTSQEKGLPSTVDPSKPLWSAAYPGKSTPVIANGKLYIMGYLGEGPDLQEGVACFDAETGKMLWNRGYNDFLSDTIYFRYATSTPAIDPETGNVYMLGTQGIMAGFTTEGKVLWQHSMMELYGRLTFPNSRTASPLIDGDLVITHGITANWGDNGPAGDRFYAFDKKTGELVWRSSPSDRPKDNSFSHPYLGWLDGKRVFYCATGDGSIVCVNARTGEPIWRVTIAKAGINATVLVHNNDKVIAIYGTPYEPGQMVAMKIPHVAPTKGEPGPVVIERPQVELWSNELSTSTTSPILVGDRISVVSEKGDLCWIDANTGKILWRKKVGIEQRTSCPLYADGKLYVPVLSSDVGAKEENSGDEGALGAFFIFKPADSGAEQLAHVSVAGRCYGTPVAYNGKVYLQTTQKLYCFGKPGNNPGLAAEVAPEKSPAAGAPTQLQVIPAEVLLKAGDAVSFRVRKLDANGFVVEEVKDIKAVKWEKYIPPTARVRATMNASFNADGKLMADANAGGSAGAWQASLGDLRGFIRGRTIANFPIREDFESFKLTETTTNTLEQPTLFAYPPLPWIGARFKFEVRDREGVKAFTKTIDNEFFRRATVFIGEPNMKNYTIQADVLSDGNRRKMSEVGIINQRYVILLKGNEKKLEVNSNLERLRVPDKDAPSNFDWSPNVWYRLKARVDLNPDGSGVVRAKAWKRDDPEPEKWTLEVPHKTAHQSGSPGLFGFSPQDMRVYIDNVIVTQN